MNILTIETTGATCGATVCEFIDGTFSLLSSVETYRENVHDALLAAHVDASVANAGLSIENIDIVAVSGGPGSFTGTRIGVSLAKGLSYSGTPRLIIIDTLDALANAALEVATAMNDTEITVVIGSHRDLFFAARYHAESSQEVETRTVHRSKDQHTVSTLLTLEETRTYAAGSLPVGPGARNVDPHTISGLARLSSRFIALTVCRQLANASVVFSNPHSAEPLYRQEFVGRREP